MTLLHLHVAFRISGDSILAYGRNPANKSAYSCEVERSFSPNVNT